MGGKSSCSCEMQARIPLGEGGGDQNLEKKGTEKRRRLRQWETPNVVVTPGIRETPLEEPSLPDH